LATKPTIYIISSDRHRNGKTLLARVLIDYLLLDGRDPFVIDANVPEGPLRAAFPGRTALVDFELVQGQMAMFDTILGSLGRDYVIDIPAPQCENFFATLRELEFPSEAERVGFQLVVLFIVDKDFASLNASDDVRAAIKPNLLIAVRNAHVGSVLGFAPKGLTIDLPILDREVVAIIEDKRFSIRSFLLGDESGMPATCATKLKIFLLAVMTAFGDIDPAISLHRLRGN
jgi:hypothetical protein